MTAAMTAAVVAGPVVGPVVGPVASPTGTAAAAAAEGDEGDPLAVSIDTLTPGTVPARARGRVTVTGVVTNTSQEPWDDLRVYLLTGSTPITTRAGLAEAADTEAASEIGERIATAGLYDLVGDLGPGESTAYRLSVRREDLGIGTEPGVYWLGVHVLGAEQGARDLVADGRNRTFLPLVPPDLVRQGVDTRLALVVSLRADVRRAAAGRLLRLPGWQRSLDVAGRLDRVLQLSGRTDAPLTWLLDPAVLDAAESVARDNPPLDTASTRGTAASPTPAPTSPSASESTGSDDQVDPGAESDPTPEAQAARRWLDELRRQAPQHTVLGLPYADLDVASALGRSLGRSPGRTTDRPTVGPDGVFADATALTALTLPTYGVEAARPVVAPATGLLPRSALRRVPGDTPVLLSTDAYPDREPGAGPVVRREDRAPVALAVATAGGPQPGERFDALAVRQRVLADAALHALSEQRAEPLVVSLPPYWEPGERWQEADFFDGLDQSWLTRVDLPSVVATAPQSPTGAADRPTPSDESADDESATDESATDEQVTGEPPTVGALRYPRADARARVPLANLRASRDVVEVGRVFARLLTDNDTVDDQLRRAALLASSTPARQNPARRRAQTQATGSYVRSQMQQVRVEGPDFVMMSGERGGISVTLVNDLDRRVTVGVSAEARGPGLKLTPPRSVTLGPGQRSAVRIDAAADDIGVHAVTVQAVTSAGAPIGSLTQLSVRTSQVGTVIWVILAVGGAVLFAAIGFRLVRQVRRRRRTHGPLLPGSDSPAESAADSSAESSADSSAESSADSSAESSADSSAGGTAVADVADPSGPHRPADRPGREIDV